MKSLRKLARPVSSLLLLFVAAGMAAQTPGPPAPAQQDPNGRPAAPPLSDAQSKIVVNSSLVIVPVTVKDSSGRLVADLQKQDFRVLEDDVEQPIDVFTAEAFPLSMVILIDNDLKSKDAKEVENSLKSIIAGMSTDDEAFVCRFDQFFHEGKGFTSDQDKLLTELRRTRLESESSVPPQGVPSNGPTINGHDVTGAPATPGSTRIIKGQSTKALDDAVFAAAELLKDRPRNRRKLILLISDGANGGKKVNTNTYESTIKELLGHGVSVFGVGVGSAVFDRRFERLSKYARDTGGDVYYAAKSLSMEELYSRITEEARNQYTLAYVPRNTNRGREYHSIEVRVKREGLTILTREGYFSGALTR